MQGEQSASALWAVDQAVPKDGLQFDQNSPLHFFHILGKLKTIKREGWRRHGIENGESIADHSHRMAMMALLAPSHLNVQRCVMMSLVHDIAESLVGDLTPMSGVSREEKGRREMSTIDYFASIAGPSGAFIRELWHEFEAAETPESRIAQDLDKVELLLQFVEYEEEGKGGIDLGEFAGVANKIRSEECKAWAREILQAREKFWGGRSHKRGEKGADGGISREYQQMQDDYYSKEQ
ncbi:hydrolase-HD superfamily protein [Colletotrichum kahawae]|uniref:5'-deoxynucleotidase n=1 Tax=Colletotrichum kahawae TaxID=34407 RepID=A0AAE0DD16_COLKA|nr:hydrolase-HD superfamily protein [Colletotrichum kahawae]